MPKPNTSFHFLKGKLKWAKVTRPNEWGKWTCTIYPDAESLEVARELSTQGVKNVIKKDEDGWYIAYHRPTEIKSAKTGRIFGLAPVVTQVRTPDGTLVPYEGLIGNGSDGTIKLEVYGGTFEGRPYKAARLLGVVVDNLVPYTTESYDEQQARATKGLEDIPRHPFN